MFISQIKRRFMHGILESRYKYWISEWSQFTSTASDRNEKILKNHLTFLVYMNEKENFRGVVF